MILSVCRDPANVLNGFSFAASSFHSYDQVVKHFPLPFPFDFEDSFAKAYVNHTSIWTNYLRGKRSDWRRAGRTRTGQRP